MKTQISLLKTEIPESHYRIDLELFEQDQSLTKELLKLSLAGIAVIGFFLQLLPKPTPSAGLSDGLFKLLLSSSVVVFALSAGLALFRLYTASSAMFHHIKAMKLALRDDPSLNAVIEEEIGIRAGKHACSHLLLKATSVFLFAGAALLGAAFVRLMYIL